MCWYHWIAISSLIFSVALFSYQFARLVILGRPHDLSVSSGNVTKGIVYSFTKAMAPGAKESAYLHMPTYAGGIIYHLGTFLSLLLFFVLITGFPSLNDPLKSIFSVLLFFSFFAGFAILIKRIINKDLKSLSGLDDYISNGVTSLVQLFTAVYLLIPDAETFYYLSVALFFIWLPLGKTKHLLFFFFARYHLGFFYGWRGTWPQKSE
ncbi:MAG: hypothetical protein PHV09_07615 [Bacteroidales bacterium]|nr:hypothetical protein [Bacteroidales bacterium]